MISEYCGDGERSCRIVALSVADQDVRDGVAACLLRWMEVLTDLAAYGGMSSVDAHDVAAEQVALLDANLVIRPDHR